jgi:hypothetical protein
MDKSTMEKLLDFLAQLDNRKIHYRLECNRAEALMVLIAVPGQRWEVEFFPDGEVEVEVFQSTGPIEDESALRRLFTQFSD